MLTVCVCVVRTHPLPPPLNSILTEEVGKGAFARVWKAKDKDTGKIYAAKVMNKSFLKRKRVGRFGNMLQTVQREVAIWKKLTHPHIVKLHEVIDDPGEWRGRSIRTAHVQERERQCLTEQPPPPSPPHSRSRHIVPN